MTGPDKHTLKELPAPEPEGRMTLEGAIVRRRCVREFADRSLTAKQISQLCWAGQGITEPKEGLRAAPSAGALYPIDLYVVAAEGVGRYLPKEHRLKRHLSEDVRPALQRGALDQAMISEAPLCVVIAATAKRMARKYGGRAEQYCFIEAGHVAQNVLLQATALDLVGVPVGAFEDRKTAVVLKIPEGWRVLYLLSIGYPLE